MPIKHDLQKQKRILMPVSCSSGKSCGPAAPNWHQVCDGRPSSCLPCQRKMALNSCLGWHLDKSVIGGRICGAGNSVSAVRLHLPPTLSNSHVHMQPQRIETSISILIWPTSPARTVRNDYFVQIPNPQSPDAGGRISSPMPIVRPSPAFPSVLGTSTLCSFRTPRSCLKS